MGGYLSMPEGSSESSKGIIRIKVLKGDFVGVGGVFHKMHCQVHITVKEVGASTWKSGRAEKSGKSCQWKDKYCDIDSSKAGLKMNIAGLDCENEPGKYDDVLLGEAEANIDAFLVSMTHTIVVFSKDKQGNQKKAGEITLSSEFIPKILTTNGEKLPEKQIMAGQTPVPLKNPGSPTKFNSEKKSELARKVTQQLFKPSQGVAASKPRQNQCQSEPLDPNLTLECGPFANVEFRLKSRYLNTDFSGDLVLYYHELKDNHKLRVQNGNHFQEIKLNVSNKLEKKDSKTIKILVFMKETMSIIFQSAEDCDNCFQAMVEKVKFAQDQHVRDMGGNLVDQIDLQSLFSEENPTKQSAELHKLLMLAGLKPNDLLDEELMAMITKTLETFKQNKNVDTSALSKRLMKLETRTRRFTKIEQESRRISDQVKEFKEEISVAPNVPAGVRGPPNAPAARGPPNAPPAGARGPPNAPAAGARGPPNAANFHPKAPPTGTRGPPNIPPPPRTTRPTPPPVPTKLQKKLTMQEAMHMKLNCDVKKFVASLTLEEQLQIAQSLLKPVNRGICAQPILQKAKSEQVPCDSRSTCISLAAQLSNTLEARKKKIYRDTSSDQEDSDSKSDWSSD